MEGVCLSSTYIYIASPALSDRGRWPHPSEGGGVGLESLNLSVSQQPQSQEGQGYPTEPCVPESASH